MSAANRRGCDFTRGSLKKSSSVLKRVISSRVSRRIGMVPGRHARTLPCARVFGAGRDLGRPRLGLVFRRRALRCGTRTQIGRVGHRVVRPCRKTQSLFSDGDAIEGRSVAGLVAVGDLHVP